MKKKILKKLYKDKAEIRSDEINKYINAGGVELIYGNKSMFLSPEALKQGKITLRGVKSKFNDTPYNLVAFNFSPNKDTRQGDLI